MNAAPHSNEGGAQAPLAGMNGARPRALFNPNTIRREIQERAARAAQQSREAALSLAAAGVAIFPAKPDKTPLDGLRWQTESTTNIARIETWWARHPGALPAIDTAKSALMVLDLDRHGDGPDGVAAGEALLGDLHALDAPITLTRNDGAHIFFKAPPGEKIGNATGSLPAGIDVRGAGYVLAPRATLPDGTGWTSDPDAPDLAEAFAAGAIPELPAHVLALIRTRPERERPEPPRQSATDAPRATHNASIGERERAYAVKALDGEVRDLAATPTGQRNPRLNEAALKIGHYVAAGWIGESEVRQELEEACFANGLIQDDGIVGVRKTIDSGLRKGMQEPAPPLADRERPDNREGRETPRFTKPDRPDEARPGDAACDADHAGEAQGGGSKPDPLAGVKFDGDEEPTPPDYLIDDLACRNDLCLLTGPSGGGKTYTVAEIAASVATGGKFLGKQCNERCGVVILPAEGAGTMATRIAAVRADRLDGEIMPIAWVEDIPDLATERGIQEIIPRLRAIERKFLDAYGVRLGLIIIDTLIAACGIENENDNAEAGAIIRKLRKLIAATNATVLAVTHTGKNQDAGTRGATAYRAGADSILTISAFRDEKTGHVSDRRIALTKSRVGAEGWNVAFTLRFVKLGEDKDGKDFGSCVIDAGQPAEHPETVSVRRKKVSAAAKMFIASLGTVMGEHGKSMRPFGHDGPAVRAVDLEVVRRELYARKSATGDDQTKQDTKRKAFDRGLEKAIEEGHVAGREIDGTYFIWFLREGAR